MKRCANDNVAVFTVRVSTLERLVLRRLETVYREGDCRFLIDAPLLESLVIGNNTGVAENDMTQIVDAYNYAHTEQLVS